MSSYAATPDSLGFVIKGDNAGSVMQDEQSVKTFPTSSLQPWQLKAISNIRELIALPDNWDSYKSPRLQMQAVRVAIELLISVQFSDLFPAPKIYPTSGGGIQFEWKVNNRELEFEILPDGSIETLRVFNGHPIKEEAFSQLSNRLGPAFNWLIFG